MTRKTSRQSAVQAELRQSRPFRSTRQEATIALLRTASIVNRALERVVEPAGLSLAQYNALRIIRGAGADGIATLSIRDRMIDEGTTITRLLDKLEEASLISRERALPDRRQVICIVTAQGKRLLDRLDPIVDAADAAVMSALDKSQLVPFIAMLDVIRTSNADRGAARTMDGRAEQPGVAVRTSLRSRRSAT
jgi:DNA-binding MarR family transcriptional regulator